jgi:predicted RNA-binding Zn-ribbon protein involved in translation (DUF1610 family)
MENYKLIVCEQCSNIISVDDNQEPLFTCPVCGTLNDRETSALYKGKVYAISPEIECEIEDPTQDTSFVLEDIDEEVQEALIILLKYGWSIKFKGDKKN